MERETIWSTRRKNYLETAGTAGTAGEEDATHSVASQHERERSTRRRDEACRTAQRRLSLCVRRTERRVDAEVGTIGGSAGGGGGTAEGRRDRRR